MGCAECGQGLFDPTDEGLATCIAARALQNRNGLVRLALAVQRARVIPQGLCLRFAIDSGRVRGPQFRRERMAGVGERHQSVSGHSEVTAVDGRLDRAGERVVSAGLALGDGGIDRPAETVALRIGARLPERCQGGVDRAALIERLGPVVVGFRLAFPVDRGAIAGGEFVVARRIRHAFQKASCVLEPALRDRRFGGRGIVVGPIGRQCAFARGLAASGISCGGRCRFGEDFGHVGACSRQRSSRAKRVDQSRPAILRPDGTGPL